MNPGLIGNWSPGIGDPSMGGWLTVVMYFIAAWVVWRLLRNWRASGTQLAQNEPWFWRALLVALIFLGLNKQLDLQSAFTEIGRIVTHRWGWYEDRRQLQMAFIAGAALMGLTLFAVTVQLTWGAPAPTIWALVGGTGLVVFVVIRAASFHHVDEALGFQFSGLRLNWLVEMGPLMLIIASAWRRRRVR